MKVKELTEQLKNYYKPNDVISYMLWSVDDVSGICEELNISLTLNQKEEVLLCIEKHKSAEYGICWDTLKDAICELFPNNLCSEEESKE